MEQLGTQKVKSLLFSNQEVFAIWLGLDALVTISSYPLDSPLETGIVRPKRLKCSVGIVGSFKKIIGHFSTNKKRNANIVFS